MQTCRGDDDRVSMALAAAKQRPKDRDRWGGRGDQSVLWPFGRARGCASAGRLVHGPAVAIPAQHSVPDQGQIHKQLVSHPPRDRPLYTKPVPTDRHMASLRGFPTHARGTDRDGQREQTHSREQNGGVRVGSRNRQRPRRERRFPDRAHAPTKWRERKGGRADDGRARDGRSAEMQGVGDETRVDAREGERERRETDGED